MAHASDHPLHFSFILQMLKLRFCNMHSGCSESKQLCIKKKYASSSVGGGLLPQLLVRQ